AGGSGLGGLLGHLTPDPAPSPGFKRNHAVATAARRDCLMWPDSTLDDATVVECTAEHKFEVAESVDMRTFPGAEYGPYAEPPSAARIEQITQEQCDSA